MELMTEYLDAKALDTLMFERTKEHDGIIQQVLQQLVWQRLPACAVLTIMAAVRGAARRLQQHYQVNPSCPNRQQPHSLSSLRFLPQSLTVAPPSPPLPSHRARWSVSGSHTLLPPETHRNTHL